MRSMTAREGWFRIHRGKRSDVPLLPGDETQTRGFVFDDRDHVRRGGDA